MNLIEAIKYLNEDIDNRVIMGGNLYKLTVKDNNLYQNNTKNFPDDCWFTIHPYNSWMLDGKFEIYKEELNFKEACIQMSNGKKVKHGDYHYTIRDVDDGYYFYGDAIFKNDEHLPISEICKLIDLKFEVVK